ncbi:hypothetical protein DFH07DRAFT_996028 [Mycena maculata]|uniref:Mg-dependent DNase n=1 Tax=Mycena maculata TaxID=230809 RepID=A0AAD7KFG6_9AGAR|nr:hypothetical protein DFH07DRAFT_996028 [Mycena maculata]
MSATVVPAAQDEKVDFRFIDIVVNLTDPVFRGTYYRKQRHEDDLSAMLERAHSAGVESMIITGTSLSESRQAVNLARYYTFVRTSSGLYCTIGCHPTRAAEFDTFKAGPDAYLLALDELLASNLQGKGRPVAIDYDRLHFATADVQQKYFRSQLSLAKKYHLPLFLHSRAAHADFVKILREEGFWEDGGRAVGGSGGVVRSFTGSVEEVVELMDMGLYISVNGCSLKTEENFKSAQAIRPDRILLETNAPWCSMTGGHASKQHLTSIPPSLRELYFPPSAKPENLKAGKSVKGRNEPCAIGGVAWVMHKLLDIPLEETTEKAFKNTLELFHLDGIP